MSNFIPSVPGMSWNRVEEHALSALTTLSPKSIEFAGPVPIEDILEFGLESLGGAFGATDLPNGYEGNTDWSIDGQFFEVSLSPAVYSNLLMGDGRARMTAAHELGHFFLHPNEIRRLRESLGGSTRQLAGLFRSRGNVPPWENPERQAEVFAGRFLLPSKSILLAIHNYDLKSVASLAETFRVTETAMGVRLRELGVRL